MVQSQAQGDAPRINLYAGQLRDQARDQPISGEYVGENSHFAAYTSVLGETQKESDRVQADPRLRGTVERVQYSVAGEDSRIMNQPSTIENSQTQQYSATTFRQAPATTEEYSKITYHTMGGGDQRAYNVENHDSGMYKQTTATTTTTTQQPMQHQKTYQTYYSQTAPATTTTTVQTFEQQQQPPRAPNNNYGSTSYSDAQGVAQRAQEQQSGMRSETSSVVRREVGEQRLISVTERTDDTRSQIISERFEERSVLIPRRIVREEIIEKHIVVPEKVRREEIIDEPHTIRERIIEVARPTIVQKVIEVPEIEYVERVVEERVTKYEDRIKNVYVDEDVKVQKPRYYDVEKIVMVPRPQPVGPPAHKEVPVYVPRDQVIERDVVVPVRKEKIVDVHRRLPVPVEAEVTYDFRMQALQAAHQKITYPVHVPRFIEVPVASERLTEQQKRQAMATIAEVQSLSKVALSLCEIESLAAEIAKAHNSSQIDKSQAQQAIIDAWHSGALKTSA